MTIQSLWYFYKENILDRFAGELDGSAMNACTLPPMASALRMGCWSRLDNSMVSVYYNSCHKNGELHAKMVLSLKGVVSFSVFMFILWH